MRWVRCKSLLKFESSKLVFVHNYKAKGQESWGSKPELDPAFKDFEVAPLDLRGREIMIFLHCFYFVEEDFKADPAHCITECIDCGYETPLSLHRKAGECALTCIIKEQKT